MTGDGELGQETSLAEETQGHSKGHSHRASSMSEATRRLAREANCTEGKKNRKRRGTDSHVMGTIPSPLFPHRKHDGSTCSELGCLTPLDGSALHRGVENSSCAACHTMMFQTVSKCADKVVNSELRRAMS